MCICVVTHYTHKLGGSVGRRQRLVGGSLFLRLSNRHNIHIPSRYHIMNAACLVSRCHATSTHVCLHTYVPTKILQEHIGTYRHACIVHTYIHTYIPTVFTCLHKRSCRPRITRVGAYVAKVYVFRLDTFLSAWWQEWCQGDIVRTLGLTV